MDRSPRNHRHGPGHWVEPDAWLNPVQGRDELDAIGREERSRKLLGIPEVDLHRTLILGVDQQRPRTKTWRAFALSRSGLSELSNPSFVELSTEAEDEQDFDHQVLVAKKAGRCMTYDDHTSWERRSNASIIWVLDASTGTTLICA